MEVSGKPPLNLKRANLAIRLVRNQGVQIVALPSGSPRDLHDEDEESEDPQSAMYYTFRTLFLIPITPLTGTIGQKPFYESNLLFYSDCTASDLI